MKRLVAAFICLVAVSLACSIQVGGSVRIAAPTSTPTATRLIPSSIPATSLVATISQAVVRVRRTPGGEETGKYVYSGDRVELSGKCQGDWCPISKPVKGWVFRGCIAELADGLLCQARP